MNVLNGSLTALNFVSGFNASATGGTINTIGFTAQALYGLTTGGTSTSTTSQSTLTDPTTMAELQTQFAADTADTTAVTAGTVTATYGTDAIYEDTTNQAFTVQSLALDGTQPRRPTPPSTPTAIRSPRAAPRPSPPRRPTR